MENQEMQKEIKKQIDEANQQLVAAIQGMVKQFNQEMDQMRSQIAQLQGSSKQNVQMSRPQDSMRTEAPRQVAAQERAPERSSSAASQRSNEPSAEVQIDKIFYCGNK
jgi:hypothetical protein